MIIPTKHLSIERSLLGIGATILESMNERETISSLWQKTKLVSDFISFEQFTLALDFLYLIGSIDYVDERIIKNK